MTVYEAGDYIGGHTNTVDVASSNGSLAVDTGFIVFNEKTYPHFCALMRELGVASQASDMSFSVRCEANGLEYNGTDLNGLFAQRSNALRPSFWRMVRDILRFYKSAGSVLDTPEDETTLGTYLEQGGYSREFIDYHLIPMGAAVWSARRETMQGFPLRFLVQFFHNHGFLQVDDRPQWRVIRGGSRSYIAPLVAPFRDRIRLNSPVTRVQRERDAVRVHTSGGATESFDRVVLACHADQSLGMLADAHPAERDVLSAFAYQRNSALLHTDASVMPRKQRAWASWNYCVADPAQEKGGADLPTVTYWMNNLQSLDSSEQYFVTLNRANAVAPERVLRSFVYHHPIYSPAAVRAQARHSEIDGLDRVHFCGAYWSYGFHEDGVRSGLRAASRVTAGAAV